jgi:hypothetical protein
MPTDPTTDIDFPVFFWKIVKNSLIFYKQALINYLLLSVITYLPFLVVDAFSSNYTIDLIEFFHGNFLDIIVFLTLPTIYLQHRVFPLATIQLFIQRFFASAVVISVVQFGILILFTLFFAQISIGVILIGLIPYIYLLFAGLFLIMENSNQTISVRNNLVNSAKLVRKRFFVIFVYYFLITFFTSLPFIFFFMWYMMGQAEFTAFEEVFRNQPENSVLLSEKLIALIESFNQPAFKWSRVGIHLLFRPVKSLFLSFLFLGILFELNPAVVKSFLGLTNGKSESEQSEDNILQDAEKQESEEK